MANGDVRFDVDLDEAKAANGMYPLFSYVKLLADGDNGEKFERQAQIFITKYVSCMKYYNKFTYFAVTSIPF